jgi:hypothetical protein
MAMPTKDDVIDLVVECTRWRSSFNRDWTRMHALRILAAVASWSKSRAATWTAVFLAAWLAGCGDSSPPAPRLASCAPGWIPTAPVVPNTLLDPWAMVWADGVLYQSRDIAQAVHAIVASPADGGDTTTLVLNDFATGMWIEGDNLLYSHDDRLMQIPRTGGDVTTILDGGPGSPSDPNLAPGLAGAFSTPLLDSSHFYWTTWNLSGDGFSHVWRLPRAGGPVEGFTPIPTQMAVGFAVLPDGVLVVGEHPASTLPLWDTFVAPSGGGNLRQLAPILGEFISVDSASALWRASSNTSDSSKLTYAVMVSPADGSPAIPLSHDLPNLFQADRGISDGQGGYYLTGYESFDDGRFHFSVFLVDSAGSATRLACDPGTDFAYSRRSAVSPSALYLAVNHTPGWTIVKIPRTLQKP